MKSNNPNDDIQYRSATLRKRQGDDDSGDVYELILSSDEPCEVWHGILEVLDHSSSAVDGEWMRSGHAPLLWMHRRDEQLGIVNEFNLEEHQSKVVVRFGESTLAKEKRADVDAEVLVNASVGYRILEEKLVESKDGVDTWRVTKWKPIEASLVTIPADETCGFRGEANRTLSKGKRAHYGDDFTNHHPKQPTPPMAEPNANPDDGGQRTADPPATPPAAPPAAPPATPATPAPDVTVVRQTAVTEERERISQITQIGADWGCETEAQEAIRNGDEVTKFQATVLKVAKGRAGSISGQQVGATPKEMQRYSLAKVIQGLVYEQAQPGSGHLRKMAPFECELSDAMTEAGAENRRGGLIVPTEVILNGYVPRAAHLQGPWADARKINLKDVQAARARIDASGAGMDDAQRSLVSVTLTGGGQTDTANTIVELELLDEMFIESLREEAVLLGLGVTMLGGLRGNVEIPMELLNPEFYTITEDQEPTEGDYTLGSFQLTFKSIGARIPFTRQAMKQTTPQIETLLTNSLRKGAALKVESLLYTGAGSATEPEGILNAAGVGSVLTAGTFSWAKLLEFRRSLGQANAGTSGAVGITNTNVGTHLMETEKSTGTGKYLADYADAPGTLRSGIGPVYESELVPNNLGAGTDKSAFLYGHPSSLFVGFWGGMELVRDEATKVASGGIVLRVFQDFDAKVSQAAKWAVATDLD